MESYLLKINELLEKNNLKIPEYQRPYKWNIKNINQLIDDILYFKDKSSYRLGTLVLHKENKDKLNIVDGQQRITSLFLIFLAIKKIEFKNLDIEKIKKDIKINENLTYNSRISQYNIKQNYQEILRRVKMDFDISTIEFLLKKCEVVVVELDDISEAFEFFDSQNARGKDLAPHDLLKAYHLRQMFDSDEEEKAKVVETWENMDHKNLAKLFNDRLYRIRNYSRGDSAKYFTKNDIDLFKGISINSKTKFLDPYAKLYQIVNNFVDNYNKNSDRLIDFEHMSYPFGLDLPILNGKRFFEMVSYYANKYNEDFLKDNEIIKLINNYSQKNRTGDKYIRNLFDCALIFYVDKFGEQDIDKVVEKLFVWAYGKRLQMQAVYIQTIDNYAISETKVFKKIKDANSYKDIVNMKIEKLEVTIKSIDKEIKEKVLGYFDGK